MRSLCRRQPVRTYLVGISYRPRHRPNSPSCAACSRRSRIRRPNVGSTMKRRSIKSDRSHSHTIEHCGYTLSIASVTRSHDNPTTTLETQALPGWRVLPEAVFNQRYVDDGHREREPQTLILPSNSPTNRTQVDLVELADRIASARHSREEDAYL